MFALAPRSDAVARPGSRRSAWRAIAARAVFAILGGFGLLAASAQELQPLPRIEHRVTDTTRTLTPDQIAALDRQLADLEARKGSQIAIVMVPTTAPETIDQYSIRLAERAKVGRKKVDDGVIVLIAKDDHRVRIEVGYGLEGAIPDIVANRVRREIMNPLLREGKFFEALQAGSASLIKVIDGEQLPPPPESEFRRPGSSSDQSGDWAAYLVPFLVLVVVLGGILKAIFGRFLGSVAVGALTGGIAWLITSAVIAGVGAGLLAFIFSLVLAGSLSGRGRRGGWPGGGTGWTGGWGGGGWSSGGGGWSSGGGGGWSGGGGSFGGGGASGSWDN